MRSTVRMLSTFLPLLATLLAGCASGRPAFEASLPHIVLEKATEEGYWEATWHLDAPTREIRFEREAAGFRAKVFESLTPGYRMERDGAVEVLRTDGEPVRALRVRFGEFDVAVPKEYAFFQKFSDGSVAIYTGHLVARAAETASDDCKECFIRRFRIKAPEGSSVLLEGRFVGQEAQWEDRHGQGMYAYLGGIDPIETAEMISIVDTAVPDWLKAETREALPRLFAMYSERTVLLLWKRDRPSHRSDDC